MVRLSSCGFLIAILMITWCHPFAVQAEGLRDFHDGWLMSMGDRAQVMVPAETRVHPPGDGRPMQPGKNRLGWWLGAGQGHLYSMKELALVSVDCGLLYRSEKWPLAFAFSWERLGESLYLEDTKTLRLRVGGRARVGVRIRVRRWLVEYEPVDSGVEVGLQGGFSFRREDSFSGEISFWVHAADLPGWHGHGGRRTLADFKLFYPGTGLALRVDQKSDGVPVLSLEILGRLAPHLGLGWRIDPETGSMGGNISARVGGVWLQTSHLVHPALGVTHRFQLGVGDPGASPW